MKRYFFMLWAVFWMVATVATAQNGFRNSSGNVLPFSTSPTTNDVITIGTTGSPISPTNKNLRLSKLFAGYDQLWEVGDKTRIGTTVGNPAGIYFSTNHGNGHGYVALGGVSGDVVLNPTTADGLLQFGVTGNAGNRIYLQYASDPSVATAYDYGFSHPLQFRCLSKLDRTYHYPGIVGFAQPDNSNHGEMWFYSRTPDWNAGNADPASPNVAGTPLLSMGTNGIITQGNTWFRGPLGSPSDIWATNNAFVGGYLRAGTRVEIGAGANGLAGTWALDISSGANPGLLLGANLSSDARTDGTDKYAYVSMMPRTHSQPKATVFQLSSTSGANTIRVGGGSSINQPATEVSIYAGTAGSAAVGNIQASFFNGKTDLKSARVLISSPTVPSSASDTGEAGTIAWDGSYVYICTAANTWKRSALATW